VCYNAQFYFFFKAATIFRNSEIKLSLPFERSEKLFNIFFSFQMEDIIKMAEESEGKSYCEKMAKLNKNNFLNI
jgi:hypothetical protein